MKTHQQIISVTKAHQISAIIRADIDLTSEDMGLILRGASTGGRQAIEKILAGLPANFSIPTIALQHVPSGLVKRSVRRHNGCCELDVLEAQAGEQSVSGKVDIFFMRGY